MGVVKRTAKPKKTIGENFRAGGGLFEPSKSRVAALNASLQEKSTFKSIRNFRFQTGTAVFKDGEEYRATITDIFDRTNDDNKRSLVVNAEAEDDKGYKETFLKFFDLVETGSSTVYRFCENFNAITKLGEINVEALIGKQAIVTLFTSKSGKKYISTIFPADDEDNETEDEIIDDEETDEYIYDNDFSYNDGEDGGCIYES